ncbi:hypothetical protein J4E08_04340 [Sagittula sp. NFXS13]|uniref:hypothetical protein n=1 Tax=Sagittula sp. NFXS13 TaxID=2819095 RepID=UPI0032E04642
MSLTLILAGPGAPDARVAAVDLLTTLTGIPPQEVAPEAVPEATRDLGLGLAIAAVVLAIPGAVVATLNLADRLRRRRALAPKVEAVKRVLEVTGTEGTIRIDDTVIRLRDESADAILDRLLPPGDDR